MAKTRNPNTSYPSVPHTSPGHPYEHIDEIHHGSDGRATGQTHGIPLKPEIAEQIRNEHNSGGGKK